jgi:hypothetical protein
VERDEFCQHCVMDFANFNYTIDPFRVQIDCIS